MNGYIGMALLGLGATLVIAASYAAVYRFGWQQGREWVWRRERDYWKENQ